MKYFLQDRPAYRADHGLNSVFHSICNCFDTIYLTCITNMPIRNFCFHLTSASVFEARICGHKRFQAIAVSYILMFCIDALLLLLYPEKHKATRNMFECKCFSSNCWQSVINHPFTASVFMRLQGSALHIHLFSLSPTWTFIIDWLFSLKYYFTNRYADTYRCKK